MSRGRLGVLVLAACSAPARPQQRVQALPIEAPRPFPEDSPFRLPHTFEPTSYRARLAIDEHRFGGHIEIEGDLSESVTLIWLHGVDLTVTRATAQHDTTNIPLEFSPPRSDQLLGLRSTAPLAPGHWTLALDYSGPIREQEAPADNWYVQGGPKMDPAALGVFRRVVGHESYVFTQSEPIFARRIFPCIDEPDRKVPWQLTLDIRRDLVGASNTPIVRESGLDAGHRRIEFAQTRPLPSYLIAFAVGPFDVVDAGKSKSGVPIRILAQHGDSARAAWAAKTTIEVLDRLEDWFGIPYAYGKLDMVAVPHAGWGAMENPGLVTFNDALLLEEQSRSTISHELAHQWFGDLVTPAWWDDIWLNESFAEWMAGKMEGAIRRQNQRRG